MSQIIHVSFFIAPIECNKAKSIRKQKEGCLRTPTFIRSIPKEFRLYFSYIVPTFHLHCQGKVSNPI